MPSAATQYATDANLHARQRLWLVSRREPAFSLHSWVVGLARLVGGEAILEVGCGNGAYLELVNGVGLDRSVGMLAAARRRTNHPLVAGDVTRLPFAADAFDVVLAPHMLYHVDDRPTAVREIRRVLRPDGICIAVTNGGDDQPELVRLVEEVVGRGWRWQRPSDVAFSLENGCGQLRGAFEAVSLVRCPPGVFHVTEAGLLGDYLRSVADHYEHQIEGSWADVADTCQRRVAEIIGTQGAFAISQSMGAFVCH